MKKIIFTLSCIIPCFNSFAQADLKLWYKAPSKVWTDALTLGNGRLGAMAYGIPQCNTIISKKVLKAPIDRQRMSKAFYVLL